MCVEIKCEKNKERREMERRRDASWSELASQRRLFQGNEDRAHSGHVLRLAARLGVEVAKPGHFLPLGAGAVVVAVLQEGVL